MIPTEDYLTEKFQQYNALMFNGKLPPISLRLSNSKRQLGAFSYRLERSQKHIFWQSKADTDKAKDLKISVSKAYDLSEETIQDTLLHEMIHYYIFIFGLQDTSQHGRIFRKMAESINTRFKRNITISHRLSQEERSTDTRKQGHFFCLVRLKDGRCGLMFPAKSRIFSLWDSPRTGFQTREYKWLYSEDAYFNRFRRCLTPKIYIVKDEEIAPHIAEALPLKNERGRISPL